jgi:hypothetical protein
MDVDPEMIPGCAGTGITATDKVCAVPEPQALFAETDIKPLLVPAVAVMLLVALVPDHPPGNVQV